MIYFKECKLDLTDLNNFSSKIMTSGDTQLSQTYTDPIQIQIGTEIIVCQIQKGDVLKFL